MWRRRLVGWIWLTLWLVVLCFVHAPFRELGGIVTERVRWAERATLGTCAILGALLGAWGRTVASRPGGPSHADQLRWLWVPVAVLGLIFVVSAEIAGEWALSLVALVGLLAYSAGLDAAFGAWPLMHGEPYAFRRPIPVEDPVTERRGLDERP